MAYRSGEVRVDDIPAGRIEETDSGYRFAYAEAYLRRPGAQPVSLGLPLRAGPYESKTLFAFFDGLIPEGWLLHIAEKTWKPHRRVSRICPKSKTPPCAWRPLPGFRWFRIS